MFAFTEFRRNITVSVIKYIRNSPYTEPFLKPKFKARISTVKSRHHMQITDYSNSLSLALTHIHIHSLKEAEIPEKTSVAFREWYVGTVLRTYDSHSHGDDRCSDHAKYISNVRPLISNKANIPNFCGISE